MIVGISRIRNEALILEDTLRHFLGYCDRIVIYDDCSTDETPEIAESFDAVEVIRGTHWDTNPHATQTLLRAAALERAKDADMVLCFDADERLEGDLPIGHAGYRFSLFDGYLTADRQEPYTSGPLEDLPRWWGPECRKILMYFDPRRAHYIGIGRREPVYNGPIVDCDMKVRHYGKCLSVAHWEDTCDFYSRYFPQWSAKWEARKGRAIHTRSDFGAALVEWSEL